MSSGGGQGPDLPRRRADQVLGWLVGVLLTGVFINLLSDSIARSPGSWIAPTVLVVVAAGTLIPQGVLRWERYGRQRWALVLAPVMLLVSASTVFGARAQGGIEEVLTLQVFSLWAATVLICWQTLNEDTYFPDAVFGVTALLVGAWFIRSGDLDDKILLGAVCLLVGVAFLILNTRFGAGWLDDVGDDEQRSMHSRLSSWLTADRSPEAVGGADKRSDP
jgi:hypothetical protein